MLQKVTSKRKPRTAPSSAEASYSDAATSLNPSPIVVAALEPHPVFGTHPIGKNDVVLDQQMIETLNVFHKRASKLLDKWNDPVPMSDDEDKRYQDIHACQCEIFRAATKIELGSGQQVATFLELFVRHLKYNDGGSSYVIDADLLHHVADSLKVATEFPRVTKKVGALSRHGKLTRAGLLYRYHAFLVGELRTLGWNLYGDDDYAVMMMPIDSEVNRWTSNYFKDGKPKERLDRRQSIFPFFDESKLTSRARSVLNSLNISTTKPDR